MSKSKHDFERSFRKLTDKIESQANGRSIISFDDGLNNLFRDTMAPRSSEALQKFAILLEGPERQGLFLRLDGPAIFLIVSTVLQFPFSSLLSKTIYFFMDILMIYKSDSKAFEALRQCLHARELEKEVKRRQRHIFHQLMRRLRDLLFDHSMHTKVRRLVAQLIMSLCNDHVPGWRGLMDQPKGYYLFGSLFRTLDDYVLRMLIADIIRHLQAQNYQMHEIWDRTDEHAMDFPSSQTIHGKGVQLVLDVMSGMDRSRAFSDNGGMSRIYRIAEINIPSLKVYSSQLDTICVLEDSITFLIPNEESGKVAFKVYEVPMSDEIVVRPGTSGKFSVTVAWDEEKGHLFLKARRYPVEAIYLQFLQDHDGHDFIEAFKGRARDLRDATRSQAASLRQNVEQPPQRKCSIALIDLPSEVDGSTDEDEPGTRSVPRVAKVVQGPRLRSRRPPEEVPQFVPESSSDLVFGQPGPSSDVFGPGGRDVVVQAEYEESSEDNGEGHHSRPSSSHEHSEDRPSKGVPLKDRLLASKTQYAHNILTGRTSSSDGSGHRAGVSPSPLERAGKRQADGPLREREGAMAHRTSMHAQDPPLTQALAASNDQDFASFRNTNDKADAATQHEDHDLPAKPQEPSLIQEPPANRASRPRTAGNSYSRGQSQGQYPKAANAMSRPKKIENVQSQHTTASPIAKKSATRLRPVKKINSQTADNISVSSAKGGQGASARGSGTIEIAAGEMKITVGAQQNESASKANESIYDLDADPAEADCERARTKEMRTTGAPIPKKPLKDPRSISRPAGSLVKAAKKTDIAKEGKTKQPPRSRKPQPQAPTRRSQRAVAKQATTYEEPPGSEIDGEEESVQEQLVDSDTPDEDDDPGESGKRRWASQLKQKKAASNRIAIASEQVQAEAFTEQTNRARGDAGGAGGNVSGYGENAKREGGLASKAVIVPSSDPLVESEDRQLAQSTQQPSDAITGAHEAAAQAQSVEQNVAKDSYPKEVQARRTDGRADASFGSKLNSFAMITQLPQARDLQQHSAPFGDAKKFIQNVNGARSSGSPVKEQPATKIDRSQARFSKATRHTAYAGIELLSDVSEAEVSPAAQTPANEDNEPLVTVHDVSVALSSLGQSRITVSGQVDEVVGQTGTDYGDRQNEDKGEEVPQQASDVGHRPEAKMNVPEKEQQSTATSLEIADSQDKDAIDYSMIRDNVAPTEATPPGAPPRSAVPQSEQMAAHDVEPPQHVEVHKGYQQKVDAPSAKAQAGLSSAADATSAAPIEQPVRQTERGQVTVQTPASHLSGMKRLTSNAVSRAPRKSSLIHFGNAGPQNQGSPIKAGAEPATTQEARWSLVTSSPKISARRSDIASEALPSGPTSTVMTEEENVDAGDLDVSQELSLSTSVELPAHRIIDRPEPRTSEKVDSNAHRPVNNVHEQNEFTEPQTAALIEVGDPEVDDSALVSTKDYGGASVPNGQRRVGEVGKDTRRVSASQRPSTSEANLGRAHESPVHTAVDKITSSNQSSLTPAQAASISISATRAQIESAIDIGHSKEVGPRALSIANKEGNPDRGSILIHGEQSVSPTKEHSYFVDQAFPKKANQVLTTRVSQANQGKDANDRIADRPAQAVITVTQTDHREASALESRSIKTTGGSGTQAPAPAPTRPLASVDNMVTQRSNHHDVNNQHKPTVAEAVPSPVARIQFQLPPPRSALVPERQSLQAGNSQESPVNISSTELFSEQDSPSQSEQESEFEASAADESLLPSESRRLTRRTAARSESYHSAPSQSEEEPLQEQPQASPPAKRRKIAKAQEMAQTMVQRPQAPDDISHFVQRQFPEARSTISFMKTTHAEPPSTLPFNLDLANVFGARDVSGTTEATSFQTPFKSYGAHLDPSFANPLSLAASHTKSARNMPSSKRTHMPPPARPMLKIDQEPVHPGSCRLTRTSDKTASYREEPANAHFSNDDSKRTSNIKRVRQLLDSPAKISQIAAPTCTPQPFHERLHAAISPTSDHATFSGPELQRRSHDHSDAGETTLVEPYFLLRDTVPRSPSVMSTNGDFEFPAKPQLEDTEEHFNNVLHGHALEVRPSTGIQQSLQQAILAMTQDICVRLEHEDEAARGLVQRYHDGCVEMLDELKHNVESRLRHDAGKLVKSTEELQTRIKNTAEMLSKPLEQNDQTDVRVPSVSGEDVTNRGQDLLEMLDGVSC